MGAEAEVAQSKLKGINGNLSRMPGVARVASAALDGLGVVAAATFVDGIKGAMDMQGAIAGIAVQTGQTTAVVAKQFTGLALAVSNATGVLSMADSMAVVNTLATYVPNTKQLRDPNFVTEVAKFADVQKLRPKDSVDILHSTASLGHIAHMLGAYSPPDLEIVAERLNKMSFATTGGIGKMEAQLGYFSEIFNRAGVPREQILNLAALGSLSLGPQKWGAGYNQFLKNLVSPTKAQAVGQYDLGLRTSPRGELKPEVLDSKGNIDFLKVNRAMAKNLEGVSGTEAVERIYRGFTINAGRLVSLTSAPKNLAYYDKLNAKMNHMARIDSMQSTLVNTLPGQTARLTTAFQSLATLIMGPLTQKLTTFVGVLADRTQDLANYAYAHPRQTEAAGVGVTALTGYLVWRAASFMRLSMHAFGKGMGVYATEGAKEVEKFEKSMVKSVTTAIGNVGKAFAGNITSKFVLPVLEQVNKLGPIGVRITSFTLGLVKNIGSLGGALSGLDSVFGAILGVLGKFGGGALSAIGSVVSYQTPAGDENDPANKAVMAAFQNRNNRYRQTHPLRTAPTQPVVQHPRHPHREPAREVGHHHHNTLNFHYHAPAGHDEATSRRHALEAHRKDGQRRGRGLRSRWPHAHARCGLDRRIVSHVVVRNRGELRLSTEVGIFGIAKVAEMAYVVGLILTIAFPFVAGLAALRHKPFRNGLVHLFPKRWQPKVNANLGPAYWCALVLLSIGAIFAQYVDHLNEKAEQSEAVKLNAEAHGDILAGERVSDRLMTSWESLNFKAINKSEADTASKLSSLQLEVSELTKRTAEPAFPVIAQTTEGPTTRPKPLSILTPSPRSSPKLLATPLAPSAEVTASPLPPLRASEQEQQTVLLGLILQTVPQATEPSGVWISQIVRGLWQGRYDGVPPPDAVDFPSATRALAELGKIRILEHAKRDYSETGNSAGFDDDYRVLLVK